MTKMKDKISIGLYIKERMTELGLSQSDLAGELSYICGKGHDKNSLRDQVSKWVRGERYPGTEYIYYLAQVLKVSIEKLLAVGYICSEYDDRPLTLYSVARKGNTEDLEKIMNTESHEGGVVGNKWDEYGKTLIDYIVQFERKDLMEYLFESGYIGKFQVFDVHDEEWKKITSFAIKHDSLLIFHSWIGRDHPIRLEVKLFGDGIFDPMHSGSRHIISYDDMNALFNAKDIFDYLTKPFDIDGENLETLSRSFNILLNIAVLEELAPAEELIQIGKSHNAGLKKQLGDRYGDDGWRIMSDGQVNFGCGYGPDPRPAIVFASIAKELYDPTRMEGLEIIK